MPIFAEGLAEMRERRLPVSFCVGDDPDEYQGETLGISPGNLILACSIELATGARLTLTFRIPNENSELPANRLVIHGQVVSGSRLSGGPFGYQVKIEPAANSADVLS
jgi:hypothetical protein